MNEPQVIITLITAPIMAAAPAALASLVTAVKLEPRALAMLTPAVVATDMVVRTTV